MTPKTKLFEQIEEYCMGTLGLPEKKDFETELKNNLNLKEEFEFECEVQAAVTEKDIMALRDKLSAITERKGTNDVHFDLLEGFANIQPLSKLIPPEELLKFYDSLPKVHVYQHELFSNENIHEFFREQNDPGISDSFQEHDALDADSDIDTAELEDAILEKDILKLRDTLSKVSNVYRKPGSAEDIDRYLNGELESPELEQFEQELAVNSLLQSEVKLHHELESALKEIDIMNLNEQLSRIIHTETSYRADDRQIEDFILGELKKEEMNAFLSELKVNAGLKSEVILRKKVEEAIREKNVIGLRDQLKQVRKEVEVKELKSIVPDKKIKSLQWWKAGVAIAILLFVMGGLFQNTFYPIERYYPSPQWSPHRSGDAGTGLLQQANSFFVKGEYDKAIQLYDKAIEENIGEKFAFRFYKGASLQNMEDYEGALVEYSLVVSDGDNMFVEEAEWYKILCNHKLGRDDAAKAQLRQIIQKNGFYANDAKAVLRKYRFSFR